MTALSEEHLAALAEGRRDAHTVQAYLSWLARYGRKRGRPRSVETVNRQLQSATERLAATDDRFHRLHLTSAVQRLSKERARLIAEDDQGDTVEAEFVRVAARYSKSRHVTYWTWIRSGVPAHVLAAAGITATPGGRGIQRRRKAPVPRYEPVQRRPRGSHPESQKPADASTEDTLVWALTEAVRLLVECQANGLAVNLAQLVDRQMPHLLAALRQAQEP